MPRAWGGMPGPAAPVLLWEPNLRELYFSLQRQPDRARMQRGHSVESIQSFQASQRMLPRKKPWLPRLADLIGSSQVDPEQTIMSCTDLRPGVRALRHNDSEPNGVSCSIY